MLELSLLLDAQDKLGVLMGANLALGGNNADTGHIDIPPIDVVALWHAVQDTRINGVAVDDFDLGKADALLEPGRCADTGDHHELD